MRLLYKLLVALPLLVTTCVTANGQTHRSWSGLKLIDEERKTHGIPMVVSKIGTKKTGNLHQKRKTKTNAHPPRSIGGAVIFRDDFNTLDTTKWKHEVSMYGNYHYQFQVYTTSPRNSFTKNGHLYIKPTLTISDPKFDENFLHHGKMDLKSLYGYCTNNFNHGCLRTGSKDRILPPVMSARLDSVPTLRYGVIEVRARIPRGDWLYSAIWMRPKTDTYGNWPRSGEIDLMEARGNSGYFGSDQVASALHWGLDADHDSYGKTHGNRVKHSWSNWFHTYRLEWTPNYIAMYVDKKRIMYVDPGKSFWNHGGFTGDNIWASGGKMAPFDQQFYLILNVAVGGATGGWNNPRIHKPWNSSSPDTAADDFWKARKSWEKTWHGDNVAMIVDYVEMRHL